MVISIPSTGAKITRLNTISGVEWEHAVLTLYDFFDNKQYEIEYCNHPNILHSLIIRPIRPYDCGKFEQVFGFGQHCEDFTKDKFVVIGKDLMY